MGRRKKERPSAEDKNETLRLCYTCVHWHEMRYTDGSRDITSGSCDKNGYSKCPAMFVCKGWENR